MKFSYVKDAFNHYCLNQNILTLTTEWSNQTPHYKLVTMHHYIGTYKNKEDMMEAAEYYKDKNDPNTFEL